MITDADIRRIKESFKDTFTTKDDLKAMEKRLDVKFTTKDDLKKWLAEIKTSIVEELTEYLQNNIILILSKHERRLDRLEKTVGGFPPIYG